jgi:hypothetical protein
MTIDECVQLRQLFEEQSGWENRVKQAFKDEEYHLVDEILRERRLFYGQYKDKVSRLLSSWYPDQNFADSIEFGNKGRVVVAGDLVLSDEKLNGSYFPRLIRKVTGKFDYHGKKLDRIDYLEKVDGNFSISESSVVSVKRLRKVGKSVIANEAKTLKDLSSLERVKNGLFIRNTSIEALPSLVHVGTSFNAEGLKSLQRLPKLNVAGNLYLKGTSLISLPELKIVRGACSLRNIVTLVELPKLKKTVRLNIEGTSITSLPNLEAVVGAFVPNKGLKNLPELKEVGRFYLLFSEMIRVPKLRKVENFMTLRYTKIRNFRKAFPQLESVGELNNVSIETTNPLLIRQLRRLQRKRKIKLAGTINKSETTLFDRIIYLAEGYL